MKPAYNQSRPDGWLKLTASAFNRLFISMLTILVAVPTATKNSLHPLSTSSIIARHLLDFMLQGKKTEADAPTIRLDATQSRLSVPQLHHPPPFLHRMPFLPHQSQFVLAWDKQAPKNSGLHTQRLTEVEK